MFLHDRNIPFIEMFYDEALLGLFDPEDGC
jgi:hypothetical protein